MRKSNGERLEAFISTAESYLGYTARADGTSVFLETVGYTANGTPWDGAFIDVVAREAGVGLRWTSHIYTPQALSNYIRDGRVFRKPRRGDIVFFDSATVGMFGAPHVGIVTDASYFLTDGTFSTIEAQTSSGLPRGSALNDGVYRRVRNNLDVLAFGRPNFNGAPMLERVISTDELPVIKPAQVRPGLRHPSVVLLQLALAMKTGVRRLPRGHFDEKTRVAYAKFQRSIGVVNADGVPELASLQRLAKESKLFQADQ